MKKTLISLVAALAAVISAPAQDNSTGSLMDKLYPQIMQASQSGDQALAKSLIEQLIEAGVDISELETAYAYSLAATGNVQKGIDRLTAYLASNPNDYFACQALGELYSKAGDKANAITWLNKSAQINPGYARPYVTLARMMAADDKAMSMQNYNKAIRLFIDANQPNGAVQLGVEAMEVEPENVELLMSLGDALLLANMTDKALVFYSEAISKSAAQTSPDVKAITDANYKIAKIYHDRGDFDSALTYLDILIENQNLTGEYKSVFIDALNLAADCHEKKGDSAAAAICREKATAFSTQ